MTKVVAEMSMSLDGFITGPKDDHENGLGIGGERLHEWLYGLEGWRETHGQEGGAANADSQLVEEGVKAAGAVMMGRRMFDLGQPHWGDTPPFHKPVYILTHRSHDSMEMQGGTTYNFVTEGLASAVNQAKAAAGDKDVSVAGGAEIIQQLLTAGLLDELQLHVVPVLFGEGRRLFDALGSDHIELEPTHVLHSPNVTHLRYRVVK